jgi:hypothetical protein
MVKSPRAPPYPEIRMTVLARSNRDISAKQIHIKRLNFLLFVNTLGNQGRA